MTELLWDSEGIGQGFSCSIVLYRALTVEIIPTVVTLP